MAFTLTSTGFSNGEAIPVQFTCDGANVSPALAWDGVPDGAAALALVMDDPDAPSGTFTHWLLADVPAGARELAGGAAPDGGVAGRNDFGRAGYGGPCPPRGHGAHRYRFQLHALAEPLGVTEGFSRADIDRALRGRVLATATLNGTYERAGRR